MTSRLPRLVVQTRMGIKTVAGSVCVVLALVGCTIQPAGPTGSGNGGNNAPASGGAGTGAESGESASSATSGSVPAELVGDWTGSNSSYHFDANGSYFFVGILSSSGSCIAFEKIEFKDEGSATVAGDKLTLNATTRRQDTTSCSGSVTSKDPGPETSQVTWSISGDVLTLTGETGPIEFTKH